MGCTDCSQEQKQLQEQFAIIQGKAKELAKQNNCNVFIFKTAEGWDYMVEQAAREQGIPPTGGIVAGLRPASEHL